MDKNELNNIIPFPVIHVSSRDSNTKGERDTSAEALDAVESNVIELQSRTLDGQQKDRRAAQRIILNRFLKAFAMTNNLGLIPVDIKNIDEQGLAFDLSLVHGRFEKGETVELRIYLSGDAYFTISCQIAHSSANAEEGVSRHGARFLTDSSNEKALHHLVAFLRQVSLSIKTDRGDRVVSDLIS